MQLSGPHQHDGRDVVIGHFQNSGTVPVSRGDWVIVDMGATAASRDALGLWVVPVPLTPSTGAPTVVGCVEIGGNPIVQDGSDPGMISVVLFGYHDRARTRTTGALSAGAWLAQHNFVEGQVGELRGLLTPGIGNEVGCAGILMEDLDLRAVDLGYTYDGSYTDITAELGSAASDVQFLTAAGELLYLGCMEMFHAVNVVLQVNASATVTPVFQYWNGTAWTVFSPTDGTTGFTGNGQIRWTKGSLAGWHRNSVNGSEEMFWIRVTAGSTVGTPPTEDTMKLFNDEQRSKVMVKCLSMAL